MMATFSFLARQQCVSQPNPPRACFVYALSTDIAIEEDRARHLTDAVRCPHVVEPKHRA
jgi:hypothetical protein